jgi:hypothetical protein
MQPNALLAWQNFIMQKVGVTMVLGVNEGLELGCGERQLARIA